MPDNDDDPTCTCGTEAGNLRHLWWRCPRWADIRGRHGLSDYAHDNLPVAAGDLGVPTSGDLAPTEDIQRMMFDIFVQRDGSIANERGGTFG